MKYLSKTKTEIFASTRSTLAHVATSAKTSALVAAQQTTRQWWQCRRWQRAAR